jgi:hypothetical protein
VFLVAAPIAALALVAALFLREVPLRGAEGRLGAKPQAEEHPAGGPEPAAPEPGARVAVGTARCSRQMPFAATWT